jgi:hypothetical protein
MVQQRVIEYDICDTADMLPKVVSERLIDPELYLTSYSGSSG